MNDRELIPSEVEKKPILPIVGVKFSNDIFLMESYLKQRNIAYESSDLEKSSLGLVLRVPKDEKGRMIFPDWLLRQWVDKKDILEQLPE
jgi:hypothetical protein